MFSTASHQGMAIVQDQICRGLDFGDQNLEIIPDNAILAGP